MTTPVLSLDEAAQHLQCSVKTLEDWLRTGRVAGLKPGVHWVLPAEAFWASVNALAQSEAIERRQARTPAPKAVSVPAPTGNPGAGTIRRRRPLATVVDMSGAPQRVGT